MRTRKSVRLRPDLEYDRLLTTSEAGAMLRVEGKRVAAWVDAGKLTEIRTPGGHRRVRLSEIQKILAGE